MVEFLPVFSLKRALLLCHNRRVLAGHKKGSPM